MSISDEIQKLAALRQSGALTEEEFSAAKRQVLSEAAAGVSHPQESLLGLAASRYVTFQMVSGVIGLMVFLVIFVVFVLPHILPPEPFFRIGLPVKP